MNATLRNEFGDGTKEGTRRDRAFERYNSLIVKNPERAVQVLGDLATGEASTRGFYDWRLKRRVNRLFKATNEGTQIGFEDAEAVWGHIHDDKEHIRARNEYNALSEDEKNTHQGIALRRKRGLQTLRVAAEINLTELQQSSNHSVAA